MADQEIQEKYILYQLLTKNMESLKEQFDVIQREFMEMRSATDSIEEIKKLGSKNEVLIPLGGGCYGKGKITENDSILVGIGSNLFLDEESSSAKKTITERGKELDKVSDEVKERMERVATELNKIGTQIQELSKKRGKA